MSSDGTEARDPLVLEPFLRSLAVHGIRAGVRDYQRIATALAASERWTLAQLCELLRVLLTKSPEQARSFPGWFHSFFAEQGALEGSVLDRERALAELRRLLQGPDGSERLSLPAPAEPPARAPEPAPDRRPRAMRLTLLLIGLLSSAWIGWLLWPQPEVAVPRRAGGS